MPDSKTYRFELDPKLEQLIMDTTERTLKDTRLDKKPFEVLVTEEIEMLCDRMGFEIKANLTKFYSGLAPEKLREHFEIIELSVEDVKKQFERERQGK